jgi:predicted site-specific integrase-resolvase
MTRFLSRAEAAALLKISQKTLANWRSLGQGPQVLNPTGGRVLYRESDVIAFIEGTPAVPVVAMPPRRGRGRPPKQRVA